MARLAAKYAAGLIALYIVTYKATGAGQLLDHATRGGSNVVKAFQGR